MSFDTPEAAAVDGIPKGEVAVLDVSLSPDQRHAVVLIAVGQSATPEVMESLCMRDADGWQERETESGSGWSWIPDFENAGVRTTWNVESALTSGFQAVEWDAPEPPPPPFGRASTATW